MRNARERGDPRKFRAWGIATGVRADVGITIATGVSAWNNRFGTSNNFSQAAGAKQPAFSASARNGRPGVVSDGVDDSMTAAFALTQPEHVFAVARWNVAAAVTEDMFDCPNANDLRCYRENIGFVHIVGNNGAADLSANVPSTTNYHVYEFKFNGASSELLYDGNSGVAGNIPTTAAGGVVLFTFGDGASNPGNVTMLEYVVFTSILSQSASNRLRNYGKAMYAL